MSRMGMNIATARRSWVPQRRLPPPEDHVTRTEGGRLCPVCWEHGRDECTEHRESTNPKGDADAR